MHCLHLHPELSELSLLHHGCIHIALQQWRRRPAVHLRSYPCLVCNLHPIAVNSSGEGKGLFNLWKTASLDASGSNDVQCQSASIRCTAMDSYGTMCDCKSVHICTDNRYWWCKVVSPPAFESKVGYEKRFLLYFAVKGPLSSSPGGSHHSQRIPQMGGRPFQTSESSELSRQCREMARNGEMDRRPAVYDHNKT